MTSSIARRAGIFCDADIEPLVFEYLFEEAPNVGFVVDDQNMGRGRFVFLVGGRSSVSPTPSIGSLIIAAAPISRLFSSDTTPPCSSTIFLTIANPSPVPRTLLVT